MKLYSLHDKKARVFLRPFVSQNDTEAIRGFLTIIQDVKSLVAQYPDEFTLVEIGEWNEETGVVNQSAQHAILMHGTQALDILVAKSQLNSPEVKNAKS